MTEKEFIDRIIDQAYHIVFDFAANRLTSDSVLPMCQLLKEMDYARFSKAFGSGIDLFRASMKK